VRDGCARGAGDGEVAHLAARRALGLPYRCRCAPGRPARGPRRAALARRARTTGRPAG
jgi:hypothetical protein